MRERYVAKRVINLLLLFLITAGFTAALCQLQGLYADELTGYLFLAFMFFVLFVYVLEYSRAEGKIADNRETDYSKISAGFFASALIILISVRLPEFLKPVILVALIMTALGSQMIAVCTGLFLCALMCLAGGGSAQEMVLCCLMLLFGCMLELTAERAHLRYWCAAIVFALAVMLPGIFYYLAYREVKLSLFLFGAVEGAVEVIFLLLVITQLAAAKHAEVSDLFADILDVSDGAGAAKIFQNGIPACQTCLARCRKVCGDCGRGQKCVRGGRILLQDWDNRGGASGGERDPHCQKRVLSGGRDRCDQ